jgi:diguanylate cyclase (GGDEF)-like protein
LLLAKRVQDALVKMSISDEKEERSGNVTISIGLAYLPDHALDIGSLINLADAAMYRAKAAGRNQFIVWDEDTELVA